MRRTIRRSRHASRPPHASCFPAGVGLMEQRALLSTYVVNTVSDLDVAGGLPAGEESLRQAIESANSDSTPDVIDFNIPGSGVQTIALASALPAISNSVTIDGWSEGVFRGTAGYDGPPLIELYGGGAGGSVNGLTITAGSSTVRGLDIGTFSGAGVLLTGNGGDTLQGNYVGANAAGTAALANSGDGVAVYSADNEIQDDLISANRSIGIYLAGSSASGNAIEGCGIGTNLAETGALGNGTWGVIINDAPGNTVGGSASGAGNVISGNDQGGIAIYGGTSVGDVVQGNKIGTDVTGTLGLGNAYSGIDVGLGTGFSPGSPGSASDAIIGGTAAGDGNVISDNGNFGVSMGLGGAGTTGIVVQGNQIGTSADGTEALPNAYGAIFLDQVTNSTIGGTTAAQRNIISGNSYAGVNIQSSTGILVAGNYIGTNAAGTAAHGQCAGRRLDLHRFLRQYDRRNGCRRRQRHLG